MMDRYSDEPIESRGRSPIYRELGDRRGIANVLKNLGDTARMQRRYNEAAVDYQLAVQTYRDIVRPRGEANTLREPWRPQPHAGPVRGRHQSLPSRSRDLSRLGSRLGEANTLTSLGDTAAMQGRHADAVDQYRQALRIYRDIRDRRGEANVCKGLGDAARMQGQSGGATDLYEQALPIYRDIGSRLREANTMLSLGEGPVAGSRRRRVEYYEQALPIYRTSATALAKESTLRRFGDIARIPWASRRGDPPLPAGPPNPPRDR